MALHAVAHLQTIDLADHGHLGNLTVAGFAFHSGINMPFVVEIGMIGQAMDTHPFDRFTLIIYGRQLFDIILVYRHYRMTAHALLDRGNTGMRAFFGPVMAIQAFHLIFAGMSLMRIGNRLIGGITNIIIDIGHEMITDNQKDYQNYDKIKSTSDET